MLTMSVGKLEPVFTGVPVSGSVKLPGAPGISVPAAIAETGASSIKEMGTVMKAAMAHLTGKSADGKMVSETVKAKLS